MDLILLRLDQFIMSHVRHVIGQLKASGLVACEKLQHSGTVREITGSNPCVVLFCHSPAVAISRWCKAGRGGPVPRSAERAWLVGSTNYFAHSEVERST